MLFFFGRRTKLLRIYLLKANFYSLRKNYKSKIMTATHVLAILTIHTDNLPENFQEIIKHEREVVAAWKAEGFLDQLFLRPTRNGAILIFKNLTEEEVNEKMKTLPLFQLMKSLEVLPLIADTI